MDQPTKPTKPAANAGKPTKTVLLANDRLLLTRKDVAHLLQVDKRIISDLSLRGGLKRVQVGLAYRYRREDVEEFVRELLDHHGVLSPKLTERIIKDNRVVSTEEIDFNLLDNIQDGES